VGSCEHCNESLGYIKGAAFLDYLSDYWLLKDCSMRLDKRIQVPKTICFTDLYDWLYPVKR
jgi:hypothetical protein